MLRRTAAQKQKLMTQLLSTKQGRARIAASITEPLRQLRDYQSIGRRAFMVDPLPDGALPIYDKDIDVPAYVVAESGTSIQTVVAGDRVLISPFEIASNPTIPFTQVKERRFDVITRIREKTRAEIFRKEDSIIFQTMSAAGMGNTVNPNIPVAANAFTLDTMADGYAELEKNGLRVDKVFMNPREFKVIRKAGRDYLDFETQRELLKTGLMGELWGAQIYQSMEVPLGKIFLCTEPEYFGVIPVRIDLTVISADLPQQRSFGWSVFEALGIGIHNVRGLQSITVT